MSDASSANPEVSEPLHAAWARATTRPRELATTFIAHLEITSPAARDRLVALGATAPESFIHAGNAVIAASADPRSIVAIVTRFARNATLDRQEIRSVFESAMHAVDVAAGGLCHDERTACQDLARLAASVATRASGGWRSSVPL